VPLKFLEGSNAAFQRTRSCYPHLLLNSGQAQAVVDMITGETAQVVFGLGGGVKTVLAANSKLWPSAKSMLPFLLQLLARLSRGVPRQRSDWTVLFGL
jgi:hypothetical protein